MNSSDALLIKGIAGLGNRMLALLSGVLFGELARRGVYVDWTDAVFAPAGDEKTRHVNLFPLLFDSDSLDPWRKDLVCEDVRPEVWRGRLGMTAANLSREIAPDRFRQYGVFRESSVDLKTLEHPSQLVVYWSWRERLLPLRRHLRTQAPELHRLSDTELLRRLAAKYLRPGAQIQEALDREWNRLPEGRIAGLHIRQSDLSSPVDELIRRAEQAISRDEADNVFLATDNTEVEDMVKTRLGPQRVYTLDKQFAAPGVPLHYDQNCVDRVKRASEALLDMLMLSRCDRLIYASRSSFGYVAHILADGGQTVEDCDRWNPKVRCKRLIQKYWYR